VIGGKRKAQVTTVATNLTTADDPEFLEVIAKGGRQAQKHALENPAFYDQETEDLFRWFETEAKRRGMKVAA
jgi:hypothetical protein